MKSFSKIILAIMIFCVIAYIIEKYWVVILIIIAALIALYIWSKVKGHVKAPAKNLAPSKASLPADKSLKPATPTAYIVLDIETTGLSRENDRIIEIAANKYSNGDLVEQFHRYINPEESIPPLITQITGITDDDVRNAPRIQDIKTDFLSFIGNYPLVGHNIKTFDVPFLQYQLHHSFSNEICDTLLLSKKAFPGLPSYKLTYLDQALYLGGLEHHRAGNDIIITNELYLACKAPKKFRKYLEDKEHLASIPVEPKKARYRDVDIHSIVPTNPYAQPNTPLTGKNVVFSGDFSLSLRKMMQIAVDAGATLKSSVSRKVDYLVVGVQNPMFTDENGMTSKSRTATRLIESGEADIKIISEQEFFQILNNKEVSV